MLVSHIHYPTFWVHLPISGVLYPVVGLHLTVVVSSRLTYTAFQRFMSSITPRFGHFSTEKRRPQSQNCPKLTKRERETPLNRARQADHGLMGSYHQDFRR